MRFIGLSVFFLLTGFSVAVESPVGVTLTQADRLHLAQVMVGEADWNQSDHIAIAWVLAKRWRHFQQNPRYDESTHDFSWFIMNYSSTMKINKNRAKRIRELPWGDPIRPHSNGVSLSVYTRRWARVRETVSQWYAGEHPDPCPKALHWGGTMDNPQEIKRPGVIWKPTSCGKTKNIFYRPVPIPTDS